MNLKIKEDAHIGATEFEAFKDANVEGNNIKLELEREKHSYSSSQVGILNKTYASGYEEKGINNGFKANNINITAETVEGQIPDIEFSKTGTAKMKATKKIDLISEKLKKHDEMVHNGCSSNLTDLINNTKELLNNMNKTSKEEKDPLDEGRGSKSSTYNTSETINKVVNGASEVLDADTELRNGNFIEHVKSKMEVSGTFTHTNSSTTKNSDHVSKIRGGTLELDAPETDVDAATDVELEKLKANKEADLKLRAQQEEIERKSNTHSATFSMGFSGIGVAGSTSHDHVITRKENTQNTNIKCLDGTKVDASGNNLNVDETVNGGEASTRDARDDLEVVNSYKANASTNLNLSGVPTSVSVGVSIEKGSKRNHNKVKATGKAKKIEEADYNHIYGAGLGLSIDLLNPVNTLRNLLGSINEIEFSFKGYGAKVNLAAYRKFYDSIKSNKNSRRKFLKAISKVQKELEKETDNEFDEFEKNKLNNDNEKKASEKDEAELKENTKKDKSELKEEATKDLEKIKVIALNKTVNDEVEKGNITEAQAENIHKRIDEALYSFISTAVQTGELVKNALYDTAEKFGVPKSVIKVAFSLVSQGMKVRGYFSISCWVAKGLYYAADKSGLKDAAVNYLKGKGYEKTAEIIVEIATGTLCAVAGSKIGNAIKNSETVKEITKKSKETLAKTKEKVSDLAKQTKEKVKQGVNNLKESLEPSTQLVDAATGRVVNVSNIDDFISGETKTIYPENNASSNLKQFASNSKKASNVSNKNFKQGNRNHNSIVQASKLNENKPNSNNKSTKKPTAPYRRELFEREGKPKNATTMKAAAIEEKGKQILRSEETGKNYDHITKAANAKRGILNNIIKEKKKLDCPTLSLEERQEAQKRLSEFSKMLDNVNCKKHTKK